jgi:HlyD family secretion protein
MLSKRTRVWLAVAAAAVVVLVLIASTRGPRGIEVEAVSVAPGRVEDAVSNSQAGTVKSRQRSRVGVEAAGRVMDIPRREGSRVRRGEIMLRLDPSTATAQLDLARRERDAARAAVAAARAGATLAERDFRRTSELFERALASGGEMDQARSRHDSAAAELEAAQARREQADASVRLAEDALARTRVLAPFDGVVTQRFVEIGESVIPGQPVLEVLDPDSLYVSAPIDEMDIGRLRLGLPARVTLDPFPGWVWRGTVIRVAPFVNDVQQQNRTLEIEVALPQARGMPLPTPGTSADVEVVLQARDSVLRVPTSAVLEGHRVLVAQRGRVASREVVTGLRNWDWTEIRSGLERGELVITSIDREGVKPGAAVQPRERAAATDTTAGGART